MDRFVIKSFEAASIDAERIALLDKGEHFLIDGVIHYKHFANGALISSGLSLGEYLVQNNIGLVTEVKLNGVSKGAVKTIEIVSGNRLQAVASDGNQTITLQYPADSGTHIGIGYNFNTANSFIKGNVVGYNGASFIPVGSSSASPAIGVVSYADGAKFSLVQSGLVEGFATGLTPGLYYVGDAAGSYSVSQPSSGTHIQPIFFAINATDIYVLPYQPVLSDVADGILDSSAVGNSANQVPLSNGAVNTGLNAALLSGTTLAALGAAAVNAIQTIAISATDLPNIIAALTNYLASSAVGNGNGQVPVNNGALNANLNVSRLEGNSYLQAVAAIADGINVSYSTSTIAEVTGLQDALDSKLNWSSVGNGNGQVPVNNGNLNVNLNVALYEGRTAAQFGAWLQAAALTSFSAANVGHTHSEYAPDTHTHAYSPIIHNHDALYALLNHLHDLNYASIGHNHPEFAGSGHIHSQYTPAVHNHDGVYSPASHNHDDRYSPAAHSHPEYAIPAWVDANFARPYAG